jgi:hypothetical protein
MVRAGATDIVLSCLPRGYYYYFKVLHRHRT